MRHDNSQKSCSLPLGCSSFSSRLSLLLLYLKMNFAPGHRRPEISLANLTLMVVVDRFKGAMAYEVWQRRCKHCVG